MEADEKTATEGREKKLKRLDFVRNLRKISPGMMDPLKKSELSRDMLTIRTFREQHKHQAISAALLESISTIHTIYPSLGSAEFFEFLLQNPFSQPATFTLEISDEELKVITDAFEWSYFKQFYGLQTRLEQNMFAYTEQDGVLRLQIFMKPSESIFIPFKYQSFQSFQAQDEARSAHYFMQSKVARVIFRNANSKEPTWLLLVQVEPQPHVTHQVFRFYHPENTFFSKFICANPSDGNENFGPMNFARCTSSNVICELRPANLANPANANQPQDVMIKASVGRSPSVRSFFVLLYRDPFMAKPDQCWQICLHAVQKIELSAAQGQQTKFSLVLRGGNADRIVCCFTSTDEISISPKEPFLLPSLSTKEIQALAVPKISGERAIQITAVDMELKELLQSWLIWLVCRPPNITRAFQVILPIGDQFNHGKRIQFTNPYNVSRIFLFTSSDENCMLVKNRQLQLQAKEAGTIQLKFPNCLQPGINELFLFINAESGNNEETYGIKVVYSFDAPS